MNNITNKSIHTDVLTLIANVHTGKTIEILTLASLLGETLTPIEQTALAAGTITLIPKPDGTSGTFTGREPREFDIKDGPATIKIPSVISGQYTHSPTECTLTFDPDTSIHVAEKVFIVTETVRIVSAAFNQTQVVVTTSPTIGDTTLTHA